MSWIPTFEIGFWNAWTLALFVILHPLIMKFVDKTVGNGNISQKLGDVPLKEGEKRAFPIPTLLLIGLFIYSIFLPLQLGTAWFFFGLAIYLVGIVMFLNSIITVAKTPMGKIFSRGMYRYSRHPLYLSVLFIFVGISVASASWVFLLFSMGWTALPISQVNAEEHSCIETFGIEYQEYMHKTPKWLGMPKSN